jgi:hypothetical protein
MDVSDIAMPLKRKQNNSGQVGHKKIIKKFGFTF